MGKITELKEYNTLKMYIAKQSTQQKIIEILEKHEALRNRAGVETAMSKLTTGEVHEGSFAHAVYKNTGLSIETSVDIAVDLLDNVLDEKRNELDAIMLEKQHNDGAEGIQEIAKQPLKLKDIFEDKEEDTKEAIQIVDVMEKAPEIKRITNEQEQNAVKEIMEIITLPLNEDQTKRLEKAIESRLKNVRDSVDTRLALARSTDTGGIGLTDVEASDVSMMIEDYMKRKWPPPFNPKINVDEKNMGQNLPPLVPLLHDNSQEKKETISKHEPENILKESKTPKKKSETVHTTLHTQTKQTEMEEKREAVLEKIKEPEPIPEKKSFFTKKPKQAPRLVGPIDELQDMSIDDWRSLFSNTKEARRGIKEKIDRLGKDSFAKKLAGIKAWREGNIMQLYLHIGKMSIEGGKSVKDINQELKETGKPYLTDDEFHAIMDLNKDLRLLA